MMKKSKRKRFPSNSKSVRKLKKPKSSNVAKNSNNLLSLPTELIEHILSYIMPYNATIDMTSTTLTQTQRRWHRELIALKCIPETKCPTILLTCRLLQQIGTGYLWRENKFVFRHLATLQKWLGKTAEQQKLGLRRLVIAIKQPAETYALPETSANLELLKCFPNLLELTLRSPEFTSELQIVHFDMAKGEISEDGHEDNRRRLVDSEWYWLGEDFSGDRSYEIWLPSELEAYAREQMSAQMAGKKSLFPIRDTMLRSIPSATLAKLRKLEIAWRALKPQYVVDKPDANGFGSWVSTLVIESRDLLVYARSLRKVEKAGKVLCNGLF